MCLWGIWLYLSLSNIPEEDFVDKAKLILTLVILTHIPLFIINTEWLIPEIFHKKGVSVYFWTLIGIIIIFSLIHSAIIESSFFNHLTLHQHRNLKHYRIVLPLVLVAAISTGYGLLNYIEKQDKYNEDKQKERLQSELSFLRSQISPHFIFNILNSIVYLIRTKSDAAEPVTLKLSELMRYMLYESENTHITLEKEILYLSNYIELQKVRFEEDVEIKFDTEGGATTQIIEPMLLIPFVENAFKHGVGMVLDPIIDIHLTINKNNILFVVKNKIAPESAHIKDNSSGIGLKNVQRRLELLYPKKHLLVIKNDNNWFEVSLNLIFN